MGNRVNKFLEANHVVRDGKLKKGCFVRLKSYQANSVKGKKYVR
jgi:replication factor A1